MPIIVNCSCGKSYQAPDHAAGKKIRCNGCGSLIPVPQSEQTISDNSRAQTASGKPVVSQPVVAQPVVAQPVVAQPVVAQPVARPSTANRPTSAAGSADSLFPPMPTSSPMDYGYPQAQTPYPPSPYPASTPNYMYGQSSQAPKSINAGAIIAWIIGGVGLVFVLFVALIVGIIYLAGSSSSGITHAKNNAGPTSSRASAPEGGRVGNAGPGGNSSATSGLSVPSNASITVNGFTAPRPTFSQSLEGGVKFGSSKYSTVGPGGNTAMNVYLPTGEHAKGSLGCVLVAPAGTNLLMGNSVEGSDYHAETLPYAKAGYVVVQYSLDGHADTDNPNVREMQRAFREFQSSNAGLWNILKVMEFLRLQMPEVNVGRIYLAGHSSAGTVALLNSGRTSIAGCLAYAPCTDPEAFHKPFENQPEVEKLFPGYKTFDRVNSPIKLASTMRVPAFIFQARDDSVVNVVETRRYVDAVKKTNMKVEYLEVPNGDHYDSMISQGIPAGIQWLKRVDAGK
ncbi:MAG: prolyl oligopeptidase family serine peptidase [Pirellulales bacterium]